MHDLSKLAHMQEAEKKRIASLKTNRSRNAAIDAQRDYMRDSSLLMSRRVQYNNDRKRRANADFETPMKKPSKKARMNYFASSRLDAVKSRLSQRHPTRFDVSAWRLYKQQSIVLLQPYYPLSAHLSFQVFGKFCSPHNSLCS